MAVRPAAEVSSERESVGLAPRLIAVAGLARLAVGPLAFAAFFLPWAHGPGPLAGEAYSGFELVGFAGRLQALEMSFAQGTTLWAIRLAILAVVVAGTWQTVLAPRHHWHLAYHVSGWYVTVFAALAAALGLLRSGLQVPPLGLGLLAAAGIAWLLACAGRASPDGVGDRDTVHVAGDG